MCGFLFTNNENEFCNLDSISHRGPDNTGTKIIDDLYFGHQRLAIIDLDERSNQPFEYNGLVLIFNGEIYNYKTLRKSLISKGYDFSTDSDTEVLIKMFHHYGIKCLNFLEGFFAFCIYSRSDNKIYFCRDRMGIKPLYYSITNSKITIGSELSCFSKGQLSNSSIYNFITFSYINAPYTLYEDINKLENTCYCEFDFITNRFNKKTYWKIDSPITSGSKYGNFSINVFKNHLLESIEKRLISDVPICSFLSGGIDSTLLVTLLKKEFNYDIPCFTIGLKDSNFDESKQAQKITDILKLEHHIKLITEEDFESIFNNMINKIDEPFGDSSMIPTMMVCRQAAKSYKVALSADGGDELMAGYPKYNGVIKNFRRLKFLSHFQKLLSPKLLEKLIMLKTKKRYRLDVYADALSQSKSMEDLLENLSKKISHSRLSKWMRIKNSLSYYRRISDSNDPNVLLLSDLINYLPGDILTKVDRASMMYSLEAREPFLDPSLFDYMSGISFEEKVKGQQLKFQFKEILSEYVRRDIWDLPKKGFSIPIEQWLRTTYEEDLKSACEALIDMGIFTDAILYDYDAFIKGNNSMAEAFWNVFILYSFLKR